MPAILLLFYLASIVLRNVHGDLEHEIPRRSTLLRRAIDGTRGRKYFDPEEEGSFDSYGSAGGQYDRYKDTEDHTDIRMNVPGEPGIDYPAYTILPQTGFSCEGRSRGYYADEVAGCQVFHVCHDILVSSFLCPIGSIFSQRLLTCDWWSKVDCSTTRKFIEINRGDYNQEDDDELIRKAYGMMGLQTGMDVTSDELVDPDRGGKIIDHRVTIQSTGNDLPNYRDHPPRFLPDDNERGEKTKTGTSYQNSFYGKDYRARPRPYQDSPIVHIRKIGEEGYQEATGFRNSAGGENGHEKSGKMINEFQPSYAPTVPTVTTTTRRFYSPTIPTTYRPSTLAYNKFDQTIESTDHLYTRSDRAGSFLEASTDSEYSGISTKRNYNDTDVRVDETSNDHRVEVKRIDLPKENLYDYDLESGSSTDVEGYADDIETRASIGLARAFNESKKFRIHVQDPEETSEIKDDKKEERDSSFTLSHQDRTYVTDTTDVFRLTESLGDKERSLNLGKTTVSINYDTRGQDIKDTFVENTTPFVPYSAFPSKVEDSPSEIEELSTTTLPYKQDSRRDNVLSQFTVEYPTSTTKVSIPRDESSYPTQQPRVFTNDPYDSATRTDLYSTVLRPDIVLKPPTEKPPAEFRINVPDYPSTARAPALSAHYITYKTGVESSTQFPRDERFLSRINASDLDPTLIKSKDLSVEDHIGDSLLEKTFVSPSNGSQTSESRNDLPYETSSTVNSLILQERDKKDSDLSRSHEIEIVRSIEEATGYGTTAGTLLPSTSFITTNETERDAKSLFSVQRDLSYHTNDSTFPLYGPTDFSNDPNKGDGDSRGSGNANALSLLQLMAELFKIDNIPRPFALNGLQNLKSRSSGSYEYWDKKETGKVAENIPPIALDITKEDFSRPRDILDGPIARPILLNDQRLALDQRELTRKEIDRSLYNLENNQPIYQLPQLQRSFDFKQSQELEDHTRSSTTSTSSTTSSTPPTTSTTTKSVKTVVETEFVPSIGFSFDTSEGQQEYIKAVLGGLLHEPILDKSDTNETTNVETTDSLLTNRSTTNH